LENGCGAIFDDDPPFEFESLVDAFALAAAYPNPTAGPTTLQVALPEASAVTLGVYDVLGRRVATLVDRELAAGTHTVRWDGRSTTGAQVGSGVYFVRMRAGDFTTTRRLMLVK
jgi:hypothetical protein